jgi:WD40 repeat protein
VKLFALAVVVILTSSAAAGSRERLSFKIPHDERSPLYSVALSTDGKTVAAGGFEKVYVCDGDTGKLRATLALADEVSALAFSPDGKSLAAVDRHAVKLWDTATNKETARFAPEKGGHVLSLAFSPDGKTLAVGSAGGVVTLWDVSAGKVRDTVAHDQEVFGSV